MLSFYEDEITTDFCLRELMKWNFRLQLPDVDPQSLRDDEQARERGTTLRFEMPRNESGWEAVRDAVLAQFSLQKLTKYDEYGRHESEIAEHED